MTGSVKYDGLEHDRDNPRTLALRRALGLSSADLVFVAGSTMEGEEAAALAAYRAARERHPRLRLVLVPRHQERFDEVAAWLDPRGRGGRPAEPWRSAPRLRSEPPPVVLVDTLGELGAAWGLADVAFVGGSLAPGRGGQNMMEPAAYGVPSSSARIRPTSASPSSSSWPGAGPAGSSDAEGLAAALMDDLDDPEAAAARGAAAPGLVLAQDGASARTLAEIDRLVEVGREPARTARIEGDACRSRETRLIRAGSHRADWLGTPDRPARQLRLRQTAARPGVRTHRPITARRRTR